MNEAETRAELIDPKLKACGWGVVEGSKVLREYHITQGKIQTGGGRGKKEIADYVLVYKGIKLAIVEAKSNEQEVGEGVMQAKKYAQKLQLETTYSTNGKAIYQICMKTGEEGLVTNFLSPDELWHKTYNTVAEPAEATVWREKFANVPFEDKSGSWQLRYYQEIAVQKVVESIAQGKDRILLTLATGTGKTAIAFQIAWKLFQTRWNLSVRPQSGTEVSRRPRILFLADRNILADQAYNSFSAFPEDALVRIKPNEIKKNGKVPTNGSIFFTIFQTFMTVSPERAQYPTEGQHPSQSDNESNYSPERATYTSNGQRPSQSDNESNYSPERAQYTSEAVTPLAEKAKYPTEGQHLSQSVNESNNSPERATYTSEAVTPLAEKAEHPNEAVTPLATTKKQYNFGQYPDNFFDFIIIDECHRGGANDESNWRGILEYFSPAVQLGLTATPKRKDNIDTYKYFGEPVYIYSLKEGINDGFLTPFKVKRIKTTLDDYRYTSDDTVVEGEIEEGKLYEEKDFNRTIEIVEREAKRVNIFLEEANQNEKTIIFCANQAHAALIRDLVNQKRASTGASPENHSHSLSMGDPFYCVRVTANDGEEGERQLREFQDNEKTLPTILTTSQKLSTGVDARNIRNIVLLRPVNSMIEFKQIVGRGTRLFDGKEFFTIYDFVDAYKHFNDPEWDGEPIEEAKASDNTVSRVTSLPTKANDHNDPYKPIPKIKVKLARGKERQIQYTSQTSFWSADGKPISAEEFLNNLFGELPKLFKDEEELRKLWSNPITRRVLLENLETSGFPKNDLLALQKLVDMEKSDLYDVLEYVFNGDYIAMSREARAKAAEATIFALLNDNQKQFIAFVLSKYIETGIDELDQEKLPILLTNKYQSLEDAKEILGDVANISKLFIDFQKHLYNQKAA